MLTESIVLAALGALSGSASRSPHGRIWSLRPPFLAQNFVELTFDARVLLFTAGVSILTGVLFGLLPSLQASRPDIVSELKEETRGGGTSRRRATLGRALVVAKSRCQSSRWSRRVCSCGVWDAPTRSTRDSMSTTSALSS
jgi:hypothetical protein